MKDRPDSLITRVSQTSTSQESHILVRGRPRMARIWASWISAFSSQERQRITVTIEIFSSHILNRTRIRAFKVFWQRLKKWFSWGNPNGSISKLADSVTPSVVYRFLCSKYHRRQQTRLRSSLSTISLSFWSVQESILVSHPVHSSAKAF